MRRYLLVAAGLATFFPPALVPISSAAQSSASDNTQIRDTQPDPGVPTLRITTREVLIDLIALDRHNRAAQDLKPDELQVWEGGEPEPNKKRKQRSDDPIAPATIVPLTSLSIFDPNNPASQRDAPTGFRIQAGCLERSTLHYLLAIRPGPSGWTSGFHRIAITTIRPDIKLFYRHRYYVGLVSPANNSERLTREAVDQLLRQSACYYPVTPLSIPLHARLIDSGRTDVVRYLVTSDVSSLSFVNLNSDSSGSSSAGIDRRFELDYGICNFDESGKPASYFHAPLDRVLNSADYARALDRGFPHILEFPAKEHAAITRVILRDRATGNMGATDVTLQQLDHAPPSARSHPGQPTAMVWTAAPSAPIGSFGSIVPAPDSFCGDVYELTSPSDKLPDFRELDPIGTLYTSSLDVPNQFFSYTNGIPGVTPRTNLFGIDYHASFWVRIPGEYRFRMASDDGALLQIDDRQIINLDGLHQVNESSGRVNLDAGLHSIHVPYYQGAPISVALELWIKPPGADEWAIFDLKDYAPPASAPDATGAPH